MGLVVASGLAVSSLNTAGDLPRCAVSTQSYSCCNHGRVPAAGLHPNSLRCFNYMNEGACYALWASRRVKISDISEMNPLVFYALEEVRCPRGPVGIAALLCRGQTAGGGSIPRWSASKPQVW